MIEHHRNCNYYIIQLRVNISLAMRSGELMRINRAQALCNLSLMLCIIAAYVDQDIFYH